MQASDYYQGLCAFLSDPALALMLETYELVLDVYPHPKFAGLADLFAVERPRVNVLEEPPVLTRYDACVTDISSVAYDFAYLGRYVQYFLPDCPQFRAGMHELRVFEPPQVFGPHAETPENALAQLCEAAKRGFAPEEEYRERMEGFFYQLEDGLEKVYRAIMA